MQLLITERQYETETATTSRGARKRGGSKPPPTPTGRRTAERPAEFEPRDAEFHDPVARATGDPLLAEA